MPEHLGKEDFVEEKCSLAVFDGLHNRSFIRKLATTELPGTEWTLHSIPMTIIRAHESELPTDHEPIKTSSFPSLLSGLFLRDTNANAVITSVGQYSETLDSSYNVSFQEARELVS